MAMDGVGSVDINSKLGVGYGVGYRVGYVLELGARVEHGAGASVWGGVIILKA